MSDLRPKWEAINGDWLIRNPRLSILHCVMLVAFLLLFLPAWHSFEFPYEKADVNRVAELDPDTWWLIKQVLLASIFISAIRIYLTFLLLENDVGFKYVLHS